MKRKERRRHPRYPAGDMPGSLLFQSRVDIINISLTGLAVDSRDRLEVDRPYHMRLTHDEEELSLDGRVVWCHLAATRRTEQRDVLPIYKAGIRFEDTLSEASKRLLSFIEHNTILTLEQRIFGRFSFRAKGAVDLKSQYEFLVKDLSLAGMRIDTEILPAPEAIYPMTLQIGNSPLELRGRVVRVKRLNPESKREARVQIGVEFQELAKASAHRLETFIRKELA